jgi:hypothetical protein
VVIWYIFSRFGILYQEKSGNPVKEMKMGHCVNCNEEINGRLPEVVLKTHENSHGGPFKRTFLGSDFDRQLSKRKVKYVAVCLVV